jgi:hypothetical protein
VRNRWWLLATLARNPSLRAARAHRLAEDNDDDDNRRQTLSADLRALRGAVVRRGRLALGARRSIAANTDDHNSNTVVDDDNDEPLLLVDLPTTTTMKSKY